MEKGFTYRLLYKKIDLMSDCYYEYYKKYEANCDFIKYLKSLGWKEKYNKYDEPIILQRHYKVAIAEKFKNFLKENGFSIYRDFHLRRCFYIYKENMKLDIQYSQGIKNLISLFSKKIGLPYEKANNENLIYSVFKQIKSDLSFVDSIKHFIDINNFKKDMFNSKSANELYKEYQKWCYEKIGFIPIKKSKFYFYMKRMFLIEMRNDKFFVYLSKEM